MADIHVTERTKEIIERLKEAWGQTRPCPLCGKVRWIVTDEMYELNLLGKIGTLKIGPKIPVVPVTCANCGNTVVLNAVIAGLMKEPEGAKL